MQVDLSAGQGELTEKKGRSREGPAAMTTSRGYNRCIHPECVLVSILSRFIRV